MLLFFVFLCTGNQTHSLALAGKVLCYWVLSPVGYSYLYSFSLTGHHILSTYGVDTFRKAGDLLPGAVWEVNLFALSLKKKPGDQLPSGGHLKFPAVSKGKNTTTVMQHILTIAAAPVTIYNTLCHCTCQTWRTFSNCCTSNIRAP